MQCTRMPKRGMTTSAPPPLPPPPHTHTHPSPRVRCIIGSCVHEVSVCPPPFSSTPCPAAPMPQWRGAWAIRVRILCVDLCCHPPDVPQGPCAAKRREVGRMVRGCVCVWRSGCSWDKRWAMSAAAVRRFCVVAQWLCAAWKAQAECSLPTPAGDPARDRIRLGYLVVGLGGGDACTFCCARDVDGRSCAYHAEGGGGGYLIGIGKERRGRGGGGGCFL